MATAHEVRMTAVKGGLFISSDEGQITYFNTSSLVLNKHGTPAMFNLGEADKSFEIFKREVRPIDVTTKTKKLQEFSEARFA